jgi:hypothetical protein
LSLDRLLPGSKALNSGSKQSKLPPPSLERCTCPGYPFKME